MNNLAAGTLAPNPLKILKNISCFKKVLKGFKTSNMETLVDVLMYQPKLIHSCMTKGFTIEDADFFKISCKVNYNIPLQSSAWFGPEKGYSLQEAVESYLPVPSFERDQLETFLKTIDLPEKIIPVNLEMKQTVDNIESTFTYKINSK